MGCGDWPVASLKVQSGCGGGSYAGLRRVVRVLRQRRCFRRVVALLGWARRGGEGNEPFGDGRGWESERRVRFQGTRPVL